MPRVFLSYSHDSPEHAERVLDLADRLRADGVDAWIDQYDPAPAEGWPLWMERQVEQADRVLAVCTATYRRRFDDRQAEGGLGVRWEGAILRGELYRRKAGFVVPVLFTRDDADYIPTAMRDGTHFVLPADHQKLYRHLTDQPRTPAPPLGEIRKLPSRQRRSLFGKTVPEKTEHKDTKLTAYRAWAKQRFQHVDLIGLGQGEMRLDLDEIYVPLRVSGLGRWRGFGDDEVELAAPRSPELKSPADTGSSLRDGDWRHAGPFRGELEDLDVEDIFHHLNERHALVLGEPGSGKTTALHKLHKVCASGPTSLGLEPETLPVFVRLRTLGPQRTSGSLADYLDAELAEAAGGRLPEGVGEQLVQHGRLLLLFDGLDEVAEENHRVDALRFLLWSLSRLDSARAVFSCRHGGWSAKLQNLDLRETSQLDVRPFEDEQIAELVERWHREAARTLQHYSMHEALAAAARLNRTLLQDREYASQQIKVLVSTPLLLTLLCLVVLRGGEIPKRRADFYEECVRVLLGSWRQQTGRKAPAEPSEMAEALEILAFFLHLGERKDDLELFEALLQLKKKLGWKPEQSRRVFDWLVQDAALLAGFGDRHYGFPHLGLQEHLAARHLAAHPEALQKIGEHYRESWWREVLQLLSSLPERSSFGPLSRFLLERGALENAQGLFRECLRAARRLELEPLREAFFEGETGGQHAVLNLLATHPEPAILSLVQDFVDRDRGISTEVREHAESLLRSQADDARVRRGVFLAHAADAETAVLDKLAQVLDDSGLEVLNPTGWPSWRDCFDTAGGAEAILLPLGTGTADAEATSLAEIYELPVWVLRLPGEHRPPLPEAWNELDVIELPGTFDPSALDRLLPSLYRLERSMPFSRSTRSATRGRDIFSLSATTRNTEVLRGGTVQARPAQSPRAAKVGEPFTEPVTGERFLPVPAGRFQMGAFVHDDEKPVHWVRLSDFWLARTPVTNQQYGLFLDATKREPPKFWRDRRFSDPQQPEVAVDWHDAVAYCEWLSATSESGLTFLLPSEAQWEYAARGGESRKYPWGNERPSEQRADFARSGGEGPRTVGSRAGGVGPFGHLDLAGTVWEWCRDYWEKDYSRWAETEPLDPVGEADPDLRPLRGGSWLLDASYLRSAFRDGNRPGVRYVSIGFRVCCLPPSL